MRTVFKLDLRLIFVNKIQEEVKLISKRLSEVKQIKMAILFGSVAKGNARNDSDIDICIVEDKGTSKALEFSSKRFDISNFFNLPIYIQHRIFKEGKVLFCKDEKLLTKLKFWTYTKYLDEKHWRDRFTKKVLS